MRPALLSLVLLAAPARAALHATLLHLLGLDHERLSYYHNGIERRLTDVHGHVIAPVSA